MVPVEGEGERMIVYCTGYLGDRVPHGTSKVKRFKQMVEEMDAILFDIRYSPNSVAPCWRRPFLEELLGERYRHVPSLGNRNYRNGGEISIVDLPAGIQQVLTSPKTPVLMCGCESASECHRMVIAQALGAFPEIKDVIEIRWWGAIREGKGGVG
jgi:hypothetical protein